MKNQHKIVYTFKVNESRYGVAFSISITTSRYGIIEASVYKDAIPFNNEWKPCFMIFGHKINGGEKIVYVGGAGKPEYFNELTSEVTAAEIHAISWLESLNYSQILDYSSMLKTEE